MTTVEDPGAALQKPDALPEVAATYCLPLTAYVSSAVHRPAGAESVKNLPVRASSVRKSPVISPVKIDLPTWWRQQPPSALTIVPPCDRRSRRQPPSASRAIYQSGRLRTSRPYTTGPG